MYFANRCCKISFKLICISLSIFQRYIPVDEEEHRQLYELVSRMLEYEPSQRITLEEALEHPFFDKLAPELKLHKLEESSDNKERSHSLSR